LYAEVRRIAGMVLSQGLRLALLGLIPGVLGAYAMARGVRALWARPAGRFG